MPVGRGLARQGLAYADAVGAEAVQVFGSNPRGWALSPGDPLQDSAFRHGCAERGLPAYVHAPYLVNLGSPTPATVTRSVQTFGHAVDRGRAAGEDLTAPRGVRRVLYHLVLAVGRGRLRLVHANGSKDALGSTRDRHERIGAGALGQSVFSDLLAHPAVRRAVVVIETPGGQADHAEDIALLQRLRDGR